MSWMNEANIGIARLFNIYGEGQNPNYAGVIARFLGRVKNREPLTIFGNGEQTRDFIHVFDVSRAVLNVVDKRAEGVFNIATGKPTSINELARKMLHLANMENMPEYMPARIGDIEHSYANIGKAVKELDWQPAVELEEGLRELLYS